MCQHMINDKKFNFIIIIIIIVVVVISIPSIQK
jgi:hypothetical protein